MSTPATPAVTVEAQAVMSRYWDAYGRVAHVSQTHYTEDVHEREEV